MQLPGWNTRDRRIKSAATTFATGFPQPFSMDTAQRVDVQGASTPTLRTGGRVLNLDFAVTDAFTAKTGLLATVFVRNGDDFTRITTSVRKQDGDRAIGTPLDRSQPAYRDALEGKPYVGYAMVFGRQCVTRYDPVRDASGRVVAILFVGMDVSQHPPMGLAWALALKMALLSAVLQAGFMALQPGAASAAWFAFMGLNTLGLGAAAFYWVHHRVTLPVNQGRQAALRLAGGDLTNQVHVSAGDDIGQLLLAINSISVGLAGLVGNVRRSAQQVEEGSREISEGNVNLATRTEQQAGEVNAAASSMHQLTATVSQTTDRTNQLSTLVSSVSRMAETGGDVVHQVVETMGQIKTSSHRINDIIALIEGIAFQTNILALNAAVEAARAGEQGRGFAVVASEVRSLAQRSSAAAHEIKDLIEASVSTANAGGALVGQARESMAQITHAIQQVVAHIDEIALSSNEQRQGIENINRSVDEIEKMTQQNAALVEQSAAASMRMRDQAEQMGAAVNGFKTPL